MPLSIACLTRRCRVSEGANAFIICDASKTDVEEFIAVVERNDFPSCSSAIAIDAERFARDGRGGAVRHDQGDMASAGDDRMRAVGVTLVRRTGMCVDIGNDG